MKFVVTSDAGLIAAQQKHLNSMRGAFDQFAHVQAKCVLLHALEHNNVLPCRDLVADMGHAKAAMNKWLVEFAPCFWGKGADGKTGLQFDKAKREEMIARRDANPKAFQEWLDGLVRFDKLTPPKDEMPAFDLVAEVRKLVAKAERIAKDETRKATAKLDGLDKLKALVPANA